MIDREKLIELLKKATIEVDEGYPMSHYKCRAVSDDVAACLADHLIANGVTVQRWIPVSERLPDKNSEYLVFLNYVKSTTILNFALDFIEHDEYGMLTEKKKSCFYYCDDDWELIEVPEVTHWMPLPQPPKGE